LFAAVPPRQFPETGSPSAAAGPGLFQAQSERLLDLVSPIGYRFHPHIEADAGVFTALQPRPDIRGARYFLDPDDRFVWVPFGIRFVSKMHGERLEFSGDGGGLYEKYHVSNPDWGFGVLSRSGWGGYFVGSAAVARDKQGHHYWLGVTPRWFLANSGFHRDRWLQISGEFSIRF